MFTTLQLFIPIRTFSDCMDSLQDLPNHLCVREVKKWYIKLLMKMLKEEAEDHEELTAPLLVVCSATKDGFKQRASHTYTYQVVGGVQHFTAICHINEGEGCQKITARRCAVYGQGLSTEATLTIAQQHNLYNQIQRTITFPEIAAACKRVLFQKRGNVTMENMIPLCHATTPRSTEIGRKPACAFASPYKW